MATVCAKQNQTRSPESIRVMVVDDHARVRQGLRLFLSTCPGIEVIAEACDGGEALRRFAETRPDVVVMDLGTPGMDSPVMTLHMKRLCPASQIVALASFRDPDMERRALEAGAACYVAKDSSTATLLEAIRAAHERAR